MLGRRDHVRREDGGHAAGALHHELQLEPVRSRLDVHPVLRAARHLRRHLGRLARAGWATQSRRRRRLLLLRWLLISALGVYSHQLWLMWLGSGIIGGCGLSL